MLLFLEGLPLNETVSSASCFQSLCAVAARTQKRSCTVADSICSPNESEAGQQPPRGHGRRRAVGKFGPNRTVTTTQQAQMEHCFDWATAEVRQRQGAVPQAKFPAKMVVTPFKLVLF